IGLRKALLTPHPLEFERLSGNSMSQLEVARAAHATVLLKGVPTAVMDPSGETTYVAEGTPILATGGAGDVLGGMAATLLAQTNNALTAGSLAAFAHGRAAREVSAIQVRGFTLEDVIDALPKVWKVESPQARPPILAELPAVADGI